MSVKAEVITNIHRQVIVRFPSSCYHEGAFNPKFYGAFGDERINKPGPTLEKKFRGGKYYVTRAGNFRATKTPLGDPGYTCKSWSRQWKSFVYQVSDYGSYKYHTWRLHGVSNKYSFDYKIVI